MPTIPHVLSGGSRELKARPLSSWVVRLGHLLDRAAFRPATLPDDLVTGIALLPPIAELVPTGQHMRKRPNRSGGNLTSGALDDSGPHAPGWGREYADVYGIGLS